MNCKRLHIRGKNPKTGKNDDVYVTVPLIATDEIVLSHPDFVAALSGPYTITQASFEPPTERQVDYATDLGIQIPKGACKEDLSALLDKRLQHDSDPNPGLVEFATNRGMMFSNCIGKKALYNLIFFNLPPTDKIAFFCFSVYRYLHGDRHANFDTSSYRKLFYSFAYEHENDKKFLAKLYEYPGESLRFFGIMRVKTDNGLIETIGGSTQTYAFKTTKAFLEKHFKLSKINSITIDKRGESKKQSKPSSPVTSFVSQSRQSVPSTPPYSLPRKSEKSTCTGNTNAEDRKLNSSEQYQKTTKIVMPPLPLLKCKEYECPNCGGKIDAKYRECDACGYYLEGESAKPWAE